MKAFVRGIERSAEMVKLAEQINGFTCEVGDICDIQLNRTMMLFITLHVVSYQTTNADLHGCFHVRLNISRPEILFLMYGSLLLF